MLVHGVCFDTLFVRIALVCMALKHPSGKNALVNPRMGGLELNWHGTC